MATTDDVRACTAHLRVVGSPAQIAANDAQCGELTDVLAPPSSASRDEVDGSPSGHDEHPQLWHPA